MDKFRIYVKDVIHECASAGGYALGSGNPVEDYVKLENCLIMLEVGRRYGK